MVKIGDRVHVAGHGYGRVTEIHPLKEPPISVRMDNGAPYGVYESNITVLRPPEIVDDGQRMLNLKALEVLIRGFEDYATHRFGCDMHTPESPQPCGCGYFRFKAQVADIKKLVGL